MRWASVAVVVSVLCAGGVRAEEKEPATSATEEKPAAGENPADAGMPAADEPVAAPVHKPNEKPAPRPVEEAPPVAPAPKAAADPMPRIRYGIQHALMGSGVAFLVVEAVALAVVAPVLLLLPDVAVNAMTGNPKQQLFPSTWRRAVGTGLVVGVVPGLLVLASLGTVATVISAVRDRGVFSPVP